MFNYKCSFRCANLIVCVYIFSVRFSFALLKRRWITLRVLMKMHSYTLRHNVTRQLHSHLCVFFAWSKCVVLWSTMRRSSVRYKICRLHLTFTTPNSAIRNAGIERAPSTLNWNYTQNINHQASIIAITLTHTVLTPCSHRAEESTTHISMMYPRAPSIEITDHKLFNTHTF